MAAKCVFAYKVANTELKLTEQRYCVTRIATLASYFLRTAVRLLRPLSTARDAEAPDGLPYRCLLSGFYQTGLDRPTFSLELFSYLFGIFPHLFLGKRRFW